LTGIDGATAARPQDRSQRPDPILDEFVLLTAEFFVEWQVDDRPALGQPAKAEEK
jgi:hypothetical protein